MNYSAIAVRYSKALFTLAQEKNLLDEIQKDISLIYSVCQDEPDFVRLLEFPVIQSSKKIEILRILFEDKIKPETFKFLQLVAQKRRESYLPAMAYAFMHRYKEKKGIKTVTFTSLGKIDEPTRQIVRDIVKKYYNADIELIELKDEKLIGGFILRIEDEQFNASVANQLEKIKREFTK
jgi:F-type H+-transporting ATPase subunit delta